MEKYCECSTRKNFFRNCLVTAKMWKIFFFSTDEMLESHFAFRNNSPMMLQTLALDCYLVHCICHLNTPSNVSYMKIFLLKALWHDFSFVHKTLNGSTINCIIKELREICWYQSWLHSLRAVTTFVMKFICNILGGEMGMLRVKRK